MISNNSDPSYSDHTEIRLTDDRYQKEQVKLDSFSVKKLPSNDFVASNSDAIERAWVQVSNPVIRDENLQKYIVYTVKGSDDQGSFEVFRRYSAFHTLREVMRSRWPGLYLPPLPEKKVIGNLDPEFVEDRRLALENFILRIQKLPYLYNSEEFQVFLRSQSQDIKTSLLSLPKPSYEDLINKYASVFGHLSGIELTNEVALKIGNFQVFLRKIKESYNIYQQVAKSLAYVKRDYYDRLALFHKNTLLDYEEKCLTEYTNGVGTPYVFKAETNSQLASDLANISQAASKPSFEAFYKNLKKEQADIDAFIETLESRDSFQTLRMKTQEKVKSDSNEKLKILSGKTTLKTIFSSKNRDQLAVDIDKNIEGNLKNIDSVTVLFDMITLIVAFVEIDKFKAEKVKNYLEIIKQMGMNELRLSEHLNTFWAGLVKVDVLKNVQASQEENIYISQNLQ